ncbi:hypothetical protein Y032_0375g229 [Ancylostoma ceylanicum]|uniref:Uncharacterized protein n=1 Tax=Ancylostoma ceylanicum TaxID=53326 RepID=A0A016RTQ7_9BILA|nr:hypothetical protein Y032_0375g229 [Ancylostoma ceylanicum]
MNRSLIKVAGRLLNSVDNHPPVCVFHIEEFIHVLWCSTFLRRPAHGHRFACAQQSSLIQARKLRMGNVSGGSPKSVHWRYFVYMRSFSLFGRIC